MKKSAKLSIFTIVAIVVGITAILYFFLYLAPSGQEKTMIQAETMLYTAQAKLIEPHLDDHTSLLTNIEEIEASIAELHNTGYTNESTFNAVLADAIQRYQLELTSLTVDNTTDYEGNIALPIQMQVTGSRSNILSFVDYFETNTDGSYLVRSATLQSSNEEKCALAMLMYLCTPAVQ